LATKFEFLVKASTMFFYPIFATFKDRFSMRSTRNSSKHIVTQSNYAITMHSLLPFAFGFALLQLSCVPSRCCAQEAAPVVQATLDSATSAKVAALDAYIEKARVDWGVPGLSVAIVQGEEVLLCKGYGVREIGTTEAIDRHTLFAIASNTKAFTAAALAVLVDEGKLQWDDRVSRYLPWLKLKDPLATADLRVRDLLCHRSGLGTFSGDLLWWGTEYTPKQILERAIELEPAGPFRAHYGYSNLMFLAAGEVIEAVSGQAWGEFVDARILKPLEMNRTIVSVRDLASLGNYATPHKTTQTDSKPIPWMNWDSMVAAGGIISSANDMSTWLKCQIRRGQLPSGGTLFSRAQSHEMWAAQMPIPVSEGSSTRFPSTHFRAYGLGWSLSDYLGSKMVGHGGGYDGMYSQVALMPERKLGVVVLTNSMTGIGSSIVYRVMDTMCDAPERDWSTENLESFRKSRVEFASQISKVTAPAASGTKPSRGLDAYCGAFRCPLYGDATVELEQDHLVLRLLPNRDLVADLTHLHYDTFVIHWRDESAWFAEGTAHFVVDSRGDFNRIELDVPNDDLWFYELKLKRVEKTK
jgi:CubicO group peptidase (beta-lactamase class C family)